MINHVMLTKFKSGVSAVDIEELERMLDDLPNRITEIHTYEFGRDLTRSARSYDFALSALFANPEALDRYQSHPRYLPIAKKFPCTGIDVLLRCGGGSCRKRFKKL